ncbi:MAG: NAD(P)-dependent oxidoreductase [Phycisphaeraceae bacterium]|nr:NAD(P)-dependent oxidoreductase [Phycisphaeraceae bacterium]
MNVLVTGSAGAVGRAVCAELLARGHHVRGLDLKENSRLPENFVGSITDFDLVTKAMADRQALVHLAAQPDMGDFVTAILPNNYLGLYYVMEAARAAGLARVVLASSMQVVSGIHQQDSLLRIEHGAAPTNHYALSKFLAEEMGRMYAHAHGLSVLAVRLGWMPRDAAAVEHIRRHQGAQNFYISPADAGRCFACCAEAGLAGKPGTAGEQVGQKGGRFGLLFATGVPVDHAIFDPAPGRILAGFTAQDRFPQGAPI